MQVGNGASAIAFGHGSVWVANTTDYSLSRIDPRASQGRGDRPCCAGVPGGVASGHEGMWVASSSTGQLLLVNPSSNRVSQSTAIGNGPRGVAVGGGSVWVANGPDGSLSRYEPSSGRVRKIAVGEAPDGVAYGDGTVWVANSRDGTVSQIDPETGSNRLIRVGNQPAAVAPVDGNAWVTVLPGPTSHRGGTLRVAAGTSGVPYSADPKAFSGAAQWQLLSLTNDGLVTYRRVGGLAGAELVPDLAIAIPQPSDGGRTYTFQLRSGIRYSNGNLVRADDVRRGIQRVLTPDNGFLASQYTGIVGAQACFEKPKSCDLGRGIVSRPSSRDNHLPPHEARPRVPLQALVRDGLGGPGRDTEGGHRTQAAARHRPVRDRVVSSPTSPGSSSATRASTSGRAKRSRTAIQTGSSSPPARRARSRRSRRARPTCCSLRRSIVSTSSLGALRISSTSTRSGRPLRS